MSDGKNVYGSPARAFGAELARESHIDADLVIPGCRQPAPQPFRLCGRSGSFPFERGLNPQPFMLGLEPSS